MQRLIGVINVIPIPKYKKNCTITKFIIPLCKLKYRHEASIKPANKSDKLGEIKLANGIAEF